MAEAVAVIGLVASIASLVDLSAKLVSRLHGFGSKTSEVPESFRSLSTRLPLLVVTLQHIRCQAEADKLPKSEAEALKSVVDDTSTQISNMQDLLSHVLPSDGASKLDRTLKALKSVAKEDKLKQSIEKIFHNNDVLGLHQATQHNDDIREVLNVLSDLKEKSPASPPPTANIPFRRDLEFVDNGDLLDKIDKQCDLPASRVALVGLGGVGKSQLAIEFGYRRKERCQDTWVFWIHAGSTARIEQGFREIADHANLQERKDPRINVFELVNNWLSSNRSGEWLLIIDNMDDVLMLGESTPPVEEEYGNSRNSKPSPVFASLPQSANGRILITSRSRTVALRLVEPREIIDTSPMAPASARILLEKKLGALTNEQDSIALAKTMDFMPLALVQAAAYISQRAPRYSVRQYLMDFEKNDRKKYHLLAHEGGNLRRGREAEGSIIVTWHMSFEHIRQVSPSAADLLSLMSFFDNHSIPENLVKNKTAMQHSPDDMANSSMYGDHVQQGQQEQQNAGEVTGRGKDRPLGTKIGQAIEGEEGESSDGSHDDDNDDDNDRFEKDIHILRDYSFISLGINQTLEMHALVQLAMRRWLENSKQLATWRRAFIKILADEFPDGTYETWAKCQLLFPHIKSAVTQQPKGNAALTDWASMLQRAAVYALRRGNLDDASSLSEKSLEVLKQTLGERNEKTLNSMEAVAVAYVDHGQRGKAADLLINVKDGRASVLGEDHPATLHGISNLGALYQRLGHLKESEELNLKALRKKILILGEEHHDTLISKSTLASCYREEGRWTEAEELQEDVARARRKLHGELHPDTLTALNSLAVTYRLQRRWNMAEQLAAQTLESRSKIFGEDSIDTLASQGNLALIYKNRRRFQEAEALAMQIMQTDWQIMGKEYPEVLKLKSTLGEIWTSYGKYCEAEQLHQQTLALMEKILGKQHPLSLTCRNCMALALVYQGHFGQAEESYRQVLALRLSVIGKRHPDTLFTMHSLAEVCARQGQYDEAERMHREALASSASVLGTRHAFTLKCVIGLALTLKRRM